MEILGNFFAKMSTNSLENAKQIIKDTARASRRDAASVIKQARAQGMHGAEVKANKEVAEAIARANRINVEGKNIIHNETLINGVAKGVGVSERNQVSKETMKWIEENAKNGGNIIDKTKAYFNDEVNGSYRKKAVVGIYGGVAVGGRILSGGSLTHNSDGERDIVGIPFI